MFPRFSHARRTRILSNAVRGVYFYADGDPTAGGGGKPPAEPAKPTGLSEADVEARVTAALEAERKKAAADRQKEAEAAERKKAEEQGEFQKLAETERQKREQAEQTAAAAERRAQLAEVNVSLRDHLAAKHPDYLANAADIMLHVERKLPPDAKPTDVKATIEAEAKAFVERTPRSRVAPPPASPSSRPPAAPAQPKPLNGEGRMTFRGPASTF